MPTSIVMEYIRLMQAQQLNNAYQEKVSFKIYLLLEHTFRKECLLFFSRKIRYYGTFFSKC